MGFSTDCIHAGQEPEPVTGAVTYPIFQTSTYVQPELGKHKGYEYARTKNPTRSVLEAALAALERGKYGHCFASGMAAIDVVFRLLQSGDHVVAGENMYGGSYRLFSRVLEKFGLQFSYVDTSRVDAVRDAIRSNTKIVFLETPTNPMMTLTDIAACAEVAHAGKALVVVDNTFCSPYLQRPIELGADIVVHSTAKFLNRVRLCSLGESLGGVETLISHPETMTHASVPVAERQRLGITPGLVRISVGIEDVDDLIDDLENAFAGI